MRYLPLAALYPIPYNLSPELCGDVAANREPLDFAASKIEVICGVRERAKIKQRGHVGIVKCCLMRRRGRVAEGGGLLNRYTGNTVSEVRILSSPPLSPVQVGGFAYSH